MWKFGSSKKTYYFCTRKSVIRPLGAIAQLVEQRTENPCVPGSIPGGTTRKAVSFETAFFVCSAVTRQTRGEQPVLAATSQAHPLRKKEKPPYLWFLLFRFSVLCFTANKKSRYLRGNSTFSTQPRVFGSAQQASQPRVANAPIADGVGEEGFDARIDFRHSIGEMQHSAQRRTIVDKTLQ